MSVLALSFHARYRCRRSGACCTSGWPIPVEDDRVALIRTGLDAGRVRLAVQGGAFTQPPAGEPVLLGRAEARCVFFDGPRRLCRIHEALGHSALPLACRQFPRVVVLDPRGVSVVLSHYCPTAASMLDEAGEVAIETNPDAFPRSGEYEGLDARESLPPLLTPDVLMDWESWWQFEALAVDLLARSPSPAALALAQLHGVIEDIRRWRPRDGSLLLRVQTAFCCVGGDREAAIDVPARVREVARAIPDGCPWPVAASAAVGEATMKRFLAAHAFANWTAHLGHGLRAWARAIDAAYALLASGLDIRQADLVLRHLADPRALARAWDAAEDDEGRLTRLEGSRRADRSSRS